MIILDAGLAEDERRHVLRHIDFRPVGDDALGTVPVGAAAVVGVSAVRRELTPCAHRNVPR